MKLTKVQANRLREIANARERRQEFLTHASICKATTQKLADLGLVRIIGRKEAKTGRVPALGWARITDAGLAALEVTNA